MEIEGWPPDPILLLDIDGLRPDVFLAALESGNLPHIAPLLGGQGMERGSQIPVLAPAPSITFCSQACLFTGSHPREHGIPGSQFFDRFGTTSEGEPRHYAFDVGDTLAVDDAVRVFTHGLASERLHVPTFYERMAKRGRGFVVAGNMYAQGATTWLPPSVLKLGRLTKGGRLFGLDPQDYDRHVLDKLLEHLEAEGLPEGHGLTMYFLGLDHHSHKYSPHAQHDYLVKHVDPMVGELWRAIRAAAPSRAPFVVLFSDHGQIAVPDEDRYGLHLGFPFDREMGHFFDALGLDVHDYPGEDPDCDAVLTLNGGLADVYLHNQTGRWSDPPDFDQDVLPVGRAFWDAHHTGKLAPEMRGALAGVLLRNVERDGWEGCYEALTPSGEVVSLEEWFAKQPADLYVDPVNRLNNLAGTFSGDLLLISNYADGYYFGDNLCGIHGGLHPDDSCATLVYAWPDSSQAGWTEVRHSIRAAIDTRCRTEGDRYPSTTDMLTGLEAALSLFGDTTVP
ncbi:MAG: alkaline phosphatase family protein [Chloroflexota bacterium]|nr:alkaline phosphatase family protein [Chloroflexota bacterium]